MYPRADDQLRELDDLPVCDIGAPLPHVVAGEGVLHLLYYTPHRDPAWDGSYATVIDSNSQFDPVAVVSFDKPLAHLCSAIPDEETCMGHPFGSLGLRPYTPFEVVHSSWIRSLEAARSVNPYHWRGLFDKARHFLFVFHDSSFECIAAGYRVELSRDSMAQTAARLAMAGRRG